MDSRSWIYESGEYPAPPADDDEQSLPRVLWEGRIGTLHLGEADMVRVIELRPKGNKPRRTVLEVCKTHDAMGAQRWQPCTMENKHWHELVDKILLGC